jgi:hypothetical protein
MIVNTRSAVPLLPGVYAMHGRTGGTPAYAGSAARLVRSLQPLPGIRCDRSDEPEVGYLPLERQAANLLFALVSRRYERGSIVVTSNRSFEQWGRDPRRPMVSAAMIDRLIHHATMVTLKGKSYRLRERGTGVIPAAQAAPLRSSA